MKKYQLIFRNIRVHLLGTILLVQGVNLYAQDYLIHFSAEGSSNKIDNIRVENLSRSNSATLSGTDVLHLKNTVTGVTSITEDNENKIKVFPNPAEQNCTVEFSIELNSNVNIIVSDVSGKNLIESKTDLKTGSHLFKIDGFSNGIYTVTVVSKEFKSNAKLIGSTAKNSESLQIVYLGTTTNGKLDLQNSTNLKSGSLEIIMQYNTGDLLKFIGTSGQYKTVLMDIPTSNKTLTFSFIPCIDPDKKNYAVVKIGKQIWMAENLAYLPAVSDVLSGSDKNPFYYVYGYNGSSVTAAKATANYASFGVLYNWAAAMKGAASSTTIPSGVKGICPEGWHLPSEAEWLVLEDLIGGTATAGTKLKSINIWNIDDKKTDEFGFNALPGGYRYYGGTFFGIGSNASFWTATGKDAAYSVSRSIDYNYEDIEHGENIMDCGYSIRCIKD
jgi:uncharacterized protein (TIGR02145 family)